MSEKIYALDIETTGLDRFKDHILCIGLYSPNYSVCFDSCSSFAEWLRENNDARFIMHRGSFDTNFLRHLGLDLCDYWVADTRSIASIYIPRPGLAEGQKHELGLENLVIQLLKEEPYKLDRTRMAEYSASQVKEYCLKDCEYTYRLFEFFVEKIDQLHWVFINEWLMPVTKFCADLEYHGVHVDKEGLEAYRAEIEASRNKVLKELNELTEAPRRFYHEQQVQLVRKQYKEMYEKAKAKAKDQAKCASRYAKLEEFAISKVEQFNWNSPAQLQWLLKDYYQLDIHSKREDKETTSEAMLKTLEHPVAEKLVEYRELEKLYSTCIPALLENISEDGAIHANYNVGGTRTGRLSSSGPNLQQIPRGAIRSYVRATSGNALITLDYGQIEVRIIAELAQEQELINAFKERIDPYSVIAQRLLQVDCPVRELKEKFPKERNVAKTAGLSILYGTGPAKLQEVLRKELGRNHTLRECRRFIDDYRLSLPGVKALRTKLERALANEGVYYNLLGRPFYIENNEDLYMKALNTLIQGSASDLVLWAQVKFVEPALKKLGIPYKYRLVVHDEVVIELPTALAEIAAKEFIIPAMTAEVENALDLKVPLTVEYAIDSCWSKP